MRPPLTLGERKLLDVFLAGLPLEWEIYVQPHLNGIKPDFVLLNPRVGVAVYEVKDWNLQAMPREWRREGMSGAFKLYRKNRSGRWFRDGNPLEKIFLYKKQIAERYAPSLMDGPEAKRILGIVTAGLVFPEANETELDEFFGPLWPSSVQKNYPRHNPIVSGEALASGDIDAIFPEAMRPAGQAMTATAAAELRAWLTEPEHTKDQRTSLPLDSHQRALVERRTESGYLRIRGAAGSGKTHVLAAKAARLALDGKRVLFLNFTITLVNYIRDLVVRAALPRKGALNNIDFYSFHDWCKWVCYEYGCEDEYRALWRNVKSDDETLDSVLAEKLALLAQSVLQPARGNDETKAVGYDAVIVDEGQDFRLSWWQTATMAGTANAEKVLCADMTQNLYGTAQAWTDQAMTGAGFTGRWSELKIAYRLPPQLVPVIRNYAERYLSDENLDLPDRTQLELGAIAKLQWRQVRTENLVDATVAAILKMPEFTSPEVVAFSDVALLVDRVGCGREIVRQLGLHGIRVSHTFAAETKSSRALKRGFFMGSERIKATTFQSFKGWEARCLVLCASEMKSQFELVAFYVALTRLKASSFGGSYLTVICSEPAFKEFGRGWFHFVDET